MNPPTIQALGITQKWSPTRRKAAGYSELTRQAKSKRDFAAPTTALTYHPTNGEPEALELRGVGRFGVTEHTHGQLADRLGIPTKYYQRMRQEAPELLAANLNTWFTKQPERRLISTLDGQARAYLSHRYRPLDHVDLAEAILPRLLAPDLRLESMALTPSRMYLKAVSPRLEGEIKKGDVVQAGIANMATTDTGGEFRNRPNSGSVGA